MRAFAVGLTLHDITYLRELWANRADAERALSRARAPEHVEQARDALRNAEAYWSAYGVPLMLCALDVAERTLKAAGPKPDPRRAHALVLSADSADPADLARELRGVADLLEDL
jgi:hypothetical protein